MAQQKSETIKAVAEGRTPVVPAPDQTEARKKLDRRIAELQQKVRQPARGRGR